VDVDAVLWLAAEAEVDVPTSEFLSQICMGKKTIFGCEGTKKSHSIQMKWEYILVNKNENAINTMLKLSPVSYQLSAI